MRSLTLFLFFMIGIGGASSAAQAECVDEDKPIPMNTPIDPCRLAKFTTLIASRGSEPGLGSGYLLAEIGNNHDVQFWYKRFFAVLDDTEHKGKVLVTRQFVFQDLKNWVPIFAKDGYNIILLRAAKLNMKGGTVTARFYDNVVSGTSTDIEFKTEFNKKTNDPEMFVQDKVFNKLELVPNKIFKKAIGIATLHFEYFNQQVLTIDLD